MFKDSNSLSSTNLPETIGLTIFGGTGEKPCDTTNDCCRTGTFGRENGTRGEKPCRDAEGEGATDDTGGQKVGTKKGTTKFGLPCNWFTNPMLVTEIGWKPRSEAARSKAWECKLDTNVVGTPPPATLEAAGTFTVDVVCVAASAYLTTATTEVKEAKNGTSGTLVRCDELPNIVRRRRRNFWDGTRSQSGQSWIQRQKPAARLLFVLRWDMLLVKNGV